MSLAEVKTKGGFKFTLWDYDGMYWPTAINGKPTEHITAIQNWKTKNDDVVVCSYPKSGTNWVWEIVAMLRRGSHEILPHTMINMEVLGIENMEMFPSPRVLQTHMLSKYLPSSFRERRGKIIYVIRNPKDVAISLYTFWRKLKDSYQGTWDDFLQLFYDGKVGYGSWFDHVKNYHLFARENPNYPIHFVYYEDVHKNCSEEIRKIANFLDMEPDVDLIEAICQQVQFKNMKTIKLNKVGHIFCSLSTDGTDPFFRKGVIGDWKNHFSVAQSEIFDKVYTKQMAGTNLRFCYSDENDNILEH